MSGWRDIATAPKDGTNVVVFAKYGASHRRPRRSRNGCFANVAHFEPGWGWLTTPGDYQVSPTHWMPLPATPESTP